MKAVTTEQIRELDRRTIAAGTPGRELMERAGYAVAKTVFELLKKSNARSVLLFAGKGNNGGDAFVAARHLAGAGCTATVVLLCRRNELQGDALHHFQQLIGVPVLDWPGEVPDAAVIVDGLLGTGFAGEVREPIASAIQFINEARRPVVAIDVPSGYCVRADVTVTIGLPKIDLLKHLDCAGRIEVADIGLIDDVESEIELITRADIVLPARKRDSHKGDFGHLLIIAGSEGYTGAPVLCAHAAARSGVGLVTLAVPRNIYPIIAGMCPPEVMPCPLESLSGKFTAAAIGPGLRQPVTQVYAAQTLLDAGALDLSAIRPGMVLTPHPGEMGRLIGKPVVDRWAVARQFAREQDVTLVLKGAGTVVTDKSGKLWINSTGNPGMAKGGMGDALTGIIGALLAQGLPPLEAAKAGVFFHGRAGDLAAERVGEVALLATDLIESLGAAFSL
ncbi:MAG: NAD(P)H-hydrate dehydratase [Verrucomicrobiota bacterium]